MPLHTKVLWGLLVGVVAGVSTNLALGSDDPRLAWIISQITEPAGQLFLRPLLMIVVPLVFSSLVMGVAGLGDVRRLGRVGLRCLGYTVVISAISVVIGLGVANRISPGKRIDPKIAEALREKYGKSAEKEVEKAQKPGSNPDSPAMQVVKTIIPQNPLAAAASDPPNMLHVMFFALLFGVALTMIGKEHAEPVLRFFDGVYHATAKLVELIMKLAPYAVACLLFTNTARFGLDLLGALGWFVGAVLLGLGLHMFGVYSLSLVFLSRISPLEFFRRTREVLLTAFSTSSSNATLPTAMRVSEQRLGVPSSINSFVLTVGATANQNGTALYEGVTVLFLAQLAGVDLTLWQQITVAYLAILGGVGTAGVPSGSIPFIILVLATIGVNPALIAIILGVDRILDMCRTTLNVAGDLTIATYVARAEGYSLLPPEPKA
jgi:DAACS family dicarboxylate/amino acid:cation (Na+ or H+) symporter